jgi:hypothetical protein
MRLVGIEIFAPGWYNVWSRNTVCGDPLVFATTTRMYRAVGTSPLGTPIDPDALKAHGPADPVVVDPSWLNCAVTVPLIPASVEQPTMIEPYCVTSSHVPVNDAPAANGVVLLLTLDTIAGTAGMYDIRAPASAKE